MSLKIIACLFGFHSWKKDVETKNDKQFRDCSVKNCGSWQVKKNNSENWKWGYQNIYYKFWFIVLLTLAIVFLYLSLTH